MIILFGRAGSGKGIQGRALAEIFGWKWLSVGQIIRATGKYDEYTEAGKLIPDDEAIKLMNKEIARAEDDGYDVILDGYPRDVFQAKYLAENMAEDIDGAILIEVPKEELYQRLELRDRADDQRREVIDERFRVFEENFAEIERIFAEKGIRILEVDGVGKVEEVTERMKKAMKELAPRATEQEDDVNGDEIEKSYGE